MIAFRPLLGSTRLYWKTCVSHQANFSKAGLQATHGFATLILADHNGERMSPAVLNTVSAAGALEGPVTLLVTGSNLAKVSDFAQSITGLTKVMIADDPSLEHNSAETLANLVVRIQQRNKFSHILAPSSTFGKNLLPRAAALLNVQPVSDVLEIIDADTFIRPIYAGNALQTVKYSVEGPRIATIRGSAFSAAALDANAQVTVENVNSEELEAAQATTESSEWISEEFAKSERPELGSAKVIISGGRALKSAENFKMLERIADRLGGAVGASRAAVDAGFVPNDMQVGQTGKVVAPDLYIAVGISGAIQHLAGMKDSKCIVAINSDPESPIFKVADYGLVADLFDAIPELEKQLGAE